MILLKCHNCGWKGPREKLRAQLEQVPDLLQRVAPGEPMPYGECPECGALCHETEKITPEGDTVTVPVDSGMLLVIDPCYLRKELGDETYKRLCCLEGSLHPVALGTGEGAWFSDFGGDGGKTVTIHRDERGKISEVKIDLP